MTFAQLVGNIVGIVNGSVIPLIFALAFVFFLINIIRYFFMDSGAEAKEKGKKALLYGLVGLVVLFTLWGIVNLLLNTFNSVVTGSTS